MRSSLKLLGWLRLRPRFIEIESQQGMILKRAVGVSIEKTRRKNRGSAIPEYEKMPTPVDDILTTQQVHFVRFLFCDNAGIIRGKAVHTGALDRFCENGIGITAAQQALPAMGDSVVPDAGLGPVGEVRLIPDFSTLTMLPYAPGHARVMGDMYQEGKVWDCCPRGFLRRIVDRAATLGLEVKAAFENEFYLLRWTPEGPLPADDTVFAATWSMDQQQAVVDELTKALVQQGLQVEAYYPESGPGQQELSIRYASALAAADRQLIFRETTRAIVLRHGLRASFLPKLFANSAGSGAHLHLSLWREGRNVTADRHGVGGLSREGRAFLAGILEHLPSLVAITAPTPNSYRRLQPRCWAGGYRVWGMDNREAALRVIGGVEGSTNWEIKAVDATCNPYLALGATIVCGLDGMARDLELPEPVNVDPGALQEAQRQQRGIEALPASLGEALVYLEKNKVLQEGMGENLFRSFVAVRRAEWLALKEKSLEEEVKLLWERY